MFFAFLGDELTKNCYQFIQIKVPVALVSPILTCIFSYFNFNFISNNVEQRINTYSGTSDKVWYHSYIDERQLLGGNMSRWGRRYFYLLKLMQRVKWGPIGGFHDMDFSADANVLFC